MFKVPVFQLFVPAGLLSSTRPIVRLATLCAVPSLSATVVPAKVPIVALSFARGARVLTVRSEFFQPVLFVQLVAVIA